MRHRLLLVAAIVAATASASDVNAATLNVATRGNELAYEPSALTVHAGEPVTLTFTNRADKTSDLRHNWVLTSKDDKEKVVSQATSAGPAKDYVPDSPAVIAHTRLLKPGESQSVQFKAPSAAGEYPFFCTFPGHSEALKGTLKVTQ